MKTLAVSLLIALLSLNSFAQEAELDSQDQAPVADYQGPASAGLSESRRDQQELSHRERYAEKQRAFNLRGIELFEQAINDAANYRMTIVVDDKVTHEETKPIKPNGSSGSIARGFADQMRRAVNGSDSTEDGTPLKFKCEQYSSLVRIPILRNLNLVNPGRCRLTLKTNTDGQKQKITLTFVMELVDTPEHQNWPSRIASPEIELKISANSEQ